jgi:hypothetical protein
MKKMIFILLSAGLVMVISCSKIGPTPKVTCHIKEYKNGNFSQEYTETNLTCEECEAQSRSYDIPDFEFPNITYHITDVARCEP